MSISFAKVEEKAPGLLNLVKQSRVELSKQGLEAARAQVVLVLDYSGSMSRSYKSGAMQRLAEKILAIATSFDDDGAIDFFVFDTNAAHLGALSLDDYIGGIDRLTNGRRMGTTNYAKAFYAVSEHFGYDASTVATVVSAAPVKKSLFGFKKETAPAQVAPSGTSTIRAALPVFAVFLTDGAPDSKPQAVKALTEVSNFPIFWKFLSIGGESMDFLQKLDDLDDRFIDNADYQHLGDIDTFSDKQLFNLLLVEYGDWVKEARAKGLIQ